MMIACCALLTGLGSCATDDALNGGGNDNGLTDVGTNYLAFNIVSDAGGGSTRAWPGETADPGDFNVGDDAEQAITTVQGSNVVLLFNDHKFHSMVNLNVNNAIKGETDDRYTAGLEKTIGTFTANIKVAEGGTDLPTKLLVVLNGNPQRLAQLETDLKAAKQLYLYDNDGTGTDPRPDPVPLDPDEYALAYLTRQLTDKAIGGSNSSIVLFSPEGSEEAEYCTMTNAVYVGTGDKEQDKQFSEDPVNSQKGGICNWTNITPDNIKTTEEEAAAAPLTVHVERLAVKVELKLGDALTKEVLGTGSNLPTVEGFKYPVLIKPAEDSKKVAQSVPDGAGGTKTEQTEWAFSMLGWSTNAVARRMYLFKNLNDARADITGATEAKGNTHYENNGINTEFFPNWNDPRHARCYWAVDGHYADSKAYPVQYRYSKDNTTNNTYKDLAPTGEKSANMPLYYYSYQQLRMIAMGLVPNAPADLTIENYETYKQPGSLRRNTAYRYCGENVLGQALIKAEGDIWRGASTHVIIFGQLLLGNEIATYESNEVKGQQFTQKLLEKASDKLYAAGSYWNRADYMKYAYTTIYRALYNSAREVVDYFGEKGKIVTPKTEFKLFYRQGETGSKKPITSEYFDGLNSETLNKVHDKFDYTKDDCNGDDDSSKCIFRLSAANVSNGDGKVMLGLKKGYQLVIEGKDEQGSPIGGDKGLEITPEKFLSLAYAIVGTADYYALGRMYYYAPIYHVATGSAATGAAPEKVGDIGVVRNNWYVLTVSSLLKPGIPVSDPEQPIIPNVDPSDRYLGLDVHILPWHVVEQNITLQ